MSRTSSERDLLLRPPPGYDHQTDSHTVLRSTAVTHCCRSTPVAQGQDADAHSRSIWQCPLCCTYAQVYTRCYICGYMWCCHGVTYVVICGVMHVVIRNAARCYACGCARCYTVLHIKAEVYKVS